RHGADGRLRPVLALAAGEAPAGPARESGLAPAEQRLRDARGHRSLADRAGAAELVRVGDVAAKGLLAETAEEATLPDDVSQGLAPIVTPALNGGFHRSDVRAGDRSLGGDRVGDLHVHAAEARAAERGG